MLSLDSTLPLPSGQGSIPILGFGLCATTQSQQSAQTALKLGYHHLDTAQIYFNEDATGSAVHSFLSQNPSLTRSNLFITSKLWEVDFSRPQMPRSFAELCSGKNWPLTATDAGHTSYTRAGALAGFHASLKATGLQYLDLYLLHNPRPGAIARTQAWLGLQDALKEGKVRAIGVSNFAPKHIEQLMESQGVNVLPAVNQIEFHPWNQQREIRKYCRSKGIVVVAYSPLSNGKRLDDAVVKDVAEKLGKSEAQVVLRWCLQSGVVVIPKSDRESRIKENMEVFGWELGREDMERIDGLDEGQKGNVGEWDPFAWD
ncbi:hypothetical protein BT93_L4834 [Corymbia citriodora subsp. variegata]|uniref:NADP-dependent oxidoreductase domain-containing protein n=1 Tax=Corymbia citriodora subsp. variegata TaxID=360336 RepID=A0A8T0CHJ3_CORYI|nr:hypothetical protein BT93_L4834 [Corymbia citriodora subsp. variegata]